MLLLTRLTFVIISLAASFIVPSAQAETREYDLTIARQDINITGSARPAMTINGGIPGPTLRFAEGDLARIRVHNTMPVETSIHWHGLLVPPGMDGVPLISFPPIAPGATFTYEFPLRQNGTYWYHSHTSLQEQSGVYGAIAIEPRDKTATAPRDFVVLFSDWADTDPHYPETRQRVVLPEKRGGPEHAWRLTPRPAGSVFQPRTPAHAGHGYLRRSL